MSDGPPEADHFGATDDEVIDSMNEDVANLTAQLRKAWAEAEALASDLAHEREVKAHLILGREAASLRANRYEKALRNAAQRRCGASDYSAECPTVWPTQPGIWCAACIAREALTP